MMIKTDKRVILCLAHMSGNEMQYIQEAFDSNWVVPLGPNVNAFEEELRRFVMSKPVKLSWENESYPNTIQPHENDPDKLWSESFEYLDKKRVVALASGTSSFL